MNKRRVLLWTLFTAYCGFVLWMTILNRTPSTVRQFEIQPFWAIKELIEKNPEAFEDILLYLENILLFIPFGFLLCSLKRLGWKRTLTVGLLVSTMIELVQYVFGLGLAEIDDLTANTFGTMLGFASWVVLNKYKNKRFDR